MSVGRSITSIGGNNDRTDHEEQYRKKCVRRDENVREGPFFPEERLTDEEVEDDERDPSEPEAPEIRNVAEEINTVERIKMQYERIRKSAEFCEKKNKIRNDNHPAYPRKDKKRFLCED